MLIFDCAETRIKDCPEELNQSAAIGPRALHEQKFEFGLHHAYKESMQSVPFA